MEIAEILAAIEVTLLQDIKEMTPKDRAAYWANLKEYNQAKLQRTSAAPLLDASTEFTIRIVENGNTGNKSI